MCTNENYTLYHTGNKVLTLSNHSHFTYVVNTHFIYYAFIRHTWYWYGRLEKIYTYISFTFLIHPEQQHPIHTPLNSPPKTPLFEIIRLCVPFFDPDLLSFQLPSFPNHLIPLWTITGIFLSPTPRSVKLPCPFPWDQCPIPVLSFGILEKISQVIQIWATKIWWPLLQSFCQHYCSVIFCLSSSPPCIALGSHGLNPYHPLETSCPLYSNFLSLPHLIGIL